MRSLVAVLLVAAFLLVGLNVAAYPDPAPSTVQEERRGYVAGGSMMGTTKVCLPREVGYDLLAACHISCPDNTCNITVVDEVRGSNILFRVCFPGETFCRPQRYFGQADVPGSIVTVVPSTSGSTTGTVTVR